MAHPRTRAPEITRHVRKYPDSGHVVDRPRDLRATRQRLRVKFLRRLGQNGREQQSSRIRRIFTRSPHRRERASMCSDVRNEHRCRRQRRSCASNPRPTMMLFLEVRTLVIRTHQGGCHVEPERFYRCCVLCTLRARRVCFHSSHGAGHTAGDNCGCYAKDPSADGWPNTGIGNATSGGGNRSGSDSCSTQTSGNRVRRRP